MDVSEKVKRRFFSVFQRTDSPSQKAVSMLLLWASMIYGGGARLRRSLYRRKILKPQKLPCPVISIGNLTAGGTGKTPMAAFVAVGLKKMGYRPAILSRGYKGKAVKQGGVVTDGHTLFMTPEEGGDEPLMLARQLSGIPILVGGNRFLSGTTAVQRYGADVLILDDGFQHLKLERQLDLVLLDRQRPLGNGRLLPRGLLREPVSALVQAHAFVLTRCDPASDRNRPEFLKRPAFQKKPVFFATHVPVVHRAADTGLEGAAVAGGDRKRGVAFSGIARNADFQHSLKTLGYDIAEFFGFSDHHAYTKRELEAIWEKAERTGAGFVATTEKDYTRIRGKIPERIPLTVIGIRLQLVDDEGLFFEWLRHRMEQEKGRLPRKNGEGEQ